MTELNVVEKETAQEIHGVALDEMSQRRMRQAIDKVVNEHLPKVVRAAREGDARATLSMTVCVYPGEYPNYECEVKSRCSLPSPRVVHRARISPENQLELFEEVD